MVAPLVPLIALSALGGLVTAVALADSDPKEAGIVVPIHPRIKVTTAQSSVDAGPDPDYLVTPTGPLPPSFFLSAQSKWNSGTNHPKYRGRWVALSHAPGGWWDKAKELRFYADPPGANRVKSEDKEFNIAWMFRAPYPSWYPLHGSKDRSVRTSLLTELIGPKADLKAVVGLLGDWFDPERLKDKMKAAGIVTGALISGGGTLLLKGKKQVNHLIDTAKDDFAGYAEFGNSMKDRTEAAARLVSFTGRQYVDQLAAANPHLIRDGKLDFSKSYMAMPQTWEDLAKEGNAYPAVYNPPEDIGDFWPNRTQDT